MYPVQYEADYNREPNRWTTFFRLLLAIPWLIVGAFWGLLMIFTHLFAWVAIVVLGRYPQWLYDFNSGVVRFGVRTSAWIYLQTDEWPPFSLSDDPSYPIRVNIAPEAERALTSSAAGTIPSALFWFGQITNQTLAAMMMPSHMPIPIVRWLSASPSAKAV